MRLPSIQSVRNLSLGLGALCCQAGCSEDFLYKETNSHEGMGGSPSVKSATKDKEASQADGMGGANEEPVAELSALSWKTSSLPDGRVHVDYEVQLSAEGEGELVFTAAEGQLPDGVSLSAQGVLSGVPKKEGVFTIDFTVRNNRGQSERVSLDVTIVLKRWLAYVSKEGGKELLKIVDYSNSLVQLTVSTAMRATTDIRGGVRGSYGFSQDGNGLAYMADKGVDGTYGLYVTDTSTKDIVGDKKVSAEGSVSSFAWSPEGSRIAFIEEDGVFVYDLETKETHNPGNGNSNLAWVNQDILTYSAKDGTGTVGFSRFEGGVFSTSREVTSGRSTSPLLKSVVGSRAYFVAGAWENSNRQGDMFIDFSDGVEVTKMPVGNNVYFSPSQEYFAATNGKVLLREGSDFTMTVAATSEPMRFLLNDESVKYKAMRWSPRGNWLVFMDDKMQLGLFDPVTSKSYSALFEGLVAGFFEEEFDWNPISPDDRWLVAADAQRNLFAISLEGEELGQPEAIIGDNATFRTTIAPSGELLVFFDAFANITGLVIQKLQLVDMSGKRPQVLRQVSSVRPSINFEFSSDSVALAYTTDDGVNLHVVDLLEKNSVGAEVTNLCSRSGDCEDKVASFVFQP